MGSQKGEQKGGATRGSSQFCFIFDKESPSSVKYKMKSFLKKGLFQKHHGGKFYVCQKAVFSYNWVLLTHFF